MSVIRTYQDGIEPPARLVVHLLGRPQVYLSGQSIDVGRWSKVLALLAYLLMEPRAHPRSELAAYWWPESDAHQAQQNLRQLLYRLRQVIQDEQAEPVHVLADQQAIRFDPESDVWVDVLTFERLLAETRWHPHRRLAVCSPCVARLEEAAALYRGQFLAGLDESISVEFEQWLLLRREGLEQQICQALHALAEHNLTHGRVEAAYGRVRWLLRLNPWNETAERLLLRTLAVREGRSAALLEYDRFHQALSTELGVEPEDGTQALVDEIRRDGMSVQPPTVSAAQQPTTPFFGREAEQAQIAAYLAEKEHRLVTILGPGGSGKTRLALCVAEAQTPDWRDGVWFIPLDQVESPDRLADTLAAFLPLAAGDGQPAHARLLDFVRPRELLLVLDNLEHLLPAGVTLLRDILRQSPRVKMLVTSRARLAIPEEWVIDLGGLDFPDEPADSTAASYGAVQLFLHHARRVRPRWTPETEDWPAIVRICQMVDGLPLGIELAAAWGRSMSCCQIADAIARDLDFLRQVQPHGPPRQHSLRAALAYSYTLLSENGQHLFRQLAVFQGGFDMPAAEQVAGADLSTLSALLDQSLLQLSAAGRWGLHPLLHRYADKELAARPAEAHAAHSRHSTCYLAFLKARQEMLIGSSARRALAELDVEMENVRAAWRWAAAQADFPALERSADALARFYTLRGLFSLGEELFQETEVLLQAHTDVDAPALMVQLRVKRAHFMTRQGRYTDAIQVARSAAELAQEADHVPSQAAAYLAWGSVLCQQSRYVKAQPLLERALALARAARQPVLEAECLRTLGAALWGQSDYTEARALLEQALLVGRAIGDQVGEGWTLNNLGLVAENSGQLDRAIAHYREALSIMEKVGDRWGESILLGNLGYAYARVGEFALAQDYYERDLRICREIGDRRGESWTLAYLSLLAHQQGQQDKARLYARRSLSVAQALDDRLLQAQALTHLGHALTELEVWDEAGDAYQQALDMRRALGKLPLAMETLAGWARLSLAQGDAGQALERVEPILEALAQDHLARTDEQMRIYLTCYRVLQANADPRARDVLARAIGVLHDRIAQIEDGELRRAFCEQVDSHCEILAAWHARLFPSDGE